MADALRAKIALLMPVRKRLKGQQYHRKPGGGRKPLDRRHTFERIVFVLRMDCQWTALLKEQFGSPSRIHKYFLAWTRAGFFVRLWRQGVAE